MMSEEDKQKIEVNRSKLVRRIQLKHNLLTELRSRAVITEQDEATIMKARRKSKKVETLIDILLQGDASTLPSFVFALKNTNHTALVEKCFSDTAVDDKTHVTTEKSQASGMTTRCQLALQKSQQELIRDLDIKPVTDCLLAKLILTREDCKRILAIHSDHDKRRLLLDLLPHRGQQAFDVLSEFLASPTNQPWLHHTLHENLERITQGEIDEVEMGHRGIGGGLTREELQDGLRTKILEYVKNDSSKILAQAQTGVYIDQNFTAQKTSNNTTEQIQLENMLKLLKSGSPGQRIFVYGAAGMGKSSLCREIAHIWAQGDPQLCQHFNYIFPIPMRSVRSHSLMDIICKDIGLIPDSCKVALQEKLDLNPAKVLFVLDSYEEQSHSTEDINKLIGREMYPDSSVIITARPGHMLEKEEHKCAPRITAQLNGLTEQQVHKYISSFPGLHKGAYSTIHDKFGKSFLQRPINLWLLCYLVAGNKTHGKVGLPGTQTALLNLILQHILLAYVKKKKWPEFDISAESPLKDANGEVKRLLKEVGRLCYLALRQRRHVLNIEDDVLSKADLLTLGLFTEGSQENSVALPHPLFQEYLAALFLSTDKYARDALLKEINRKSENMSPRLCLVDVLRPLGLENVIKFLVGLVPAVANLLSSLFVIKESRLMFGYQCDIQYELDLLKEHDDVVIKSVIAKSLLNAPVVTYNEARDPVVNHGSHQLLNIFTDEERKMFLQKVYNCQLREQDDRLILSKIRDNRGCYWDCYVVGFVSHIMNNCSIQMKELNIIYSNVPVHMIAHNMRDVGMLYIADCALVQWSPRALPVTNNALSTSSIRELYLTRVQGVSQLYTLKLPGTSTLVLNTCDDIISLEGLTRVFPELESLEVWWSTVCGDRHDQTTWLSLRHLWLFHSHLGEAPHSEIAACAKLSYMCPRAKLKIDYYEDSPRDDDKEDKDSPRDDDEEDKNKIASAEGGEVESTYLADYNATTRVDGWTKRWDSPL